MKNQHITLTSFDTVLCERLNHIPWSQTARAALANVVKLLKHNGFTEQNTIKNESEISLVLIKNKDMYYIGKTLVNTEWVTYIQHTTEIDY